MKKNWISLGLMSGTSGDGVDASSLHEEASTIALGRNQKQRQLVDFQDHERVR